MANQSTRCITDTFYFLGKIVIKCLYTDIKCQPIYSTTPLYSTLKNSPIFSWHTALADSFNHEVPGGAFGRRTRVDTAQ